MSSRTRLTLCSALATVLVACSLLPLVTPTGWMLQAIALVGMQALAAALARRVPLARPLTILAQLATVLVLLTFTFARDVAVLGFLPGPGALRALGELVTTGVNDVGQYQTPAPVTEGIRLLLVGGVVLIAVVVDALAVTYRNAAPAGLPLLALYSVAAGLSTGGARWLWFVLAGAGYLLLLLAEGRDRLSRWGRVFAGAPAGSGGGSPSFMGGGPGGETATAPVRAGRRIGAMALGIALVAPVALPSLGDGLLGQAGAGGGPGGPGDSTITAVNPLVSLQDSLNQPQDREVLSYRTTAASNSDVYLRIVALDQFDGTEWKPSQRRVEQVRDPLPGPPGLSEAVEADEIRTSVAAARGYRQNWLPLPYPVTSVNIDGRWRFEPEGRTLVGDRGQTTSGVQYQVNSLVVRPTAEQLAQAPPPDSQLQKEYTDVPRSLPRLVASEARRVTAGATNNYQKAVRLQDWFARSGEFTYDTEVTAGTGAKAVERFLKTKEGFCVHFAFTMAAMARTLDIPARVAVGYVPGAAEPDGSWSVGIKDAHAWPELYFEGVGWTRFEPTPSRGSTPAYAQPEFPSTGTDEEDPAARNPAVPTAAPSSSATCDIRAQQRGDCSPEDAAALTGTPDDGFPSGPQLAVGIAVLVLLLLPTLPMLWRMRIRRQRLDVGTTGPAQALAQEQEHEADGERASVRTLAAWQELLDSAWDFGTVPDGSETPRRAVDRIVEERGLEGSAAESARRVAAAVEQVLYAPAPRAVAGLAEDVRGVRAALPVGLSRRTRLRAVLMPRSSVRVLWSAAARWSRTRDRWAAAWAAAVRRVPFPSRPRESTTTPR